MPNATLLLFLSLFMLFIDSIIVFAITSPYSLFFHCSSPEPISIKIVGEEIPHAHIWVFPNPETVNGEKTDFEGNKMKIIENL